MLRIGKRYLRLQRHSYSEFQSLYGIGTNISAALCSYLGMRKEYILFTMPKGHNIMHSLLDFFNRIEIYLEFHLRKDLQSNLELLRKLRAYRGVRYFRGFPIRGQRRHTNALTARRRRL